MFAKVPVLFGRDAKVNIRWQQLKLSPSRIKLHGSATVSFVRIHDSRTVQNYSENDLKHQFQSTLVISKSKRLSEILRDIRTSTYQICRTDEKINRTTTCQK